MSSGFEIFVRNIKNLQDSKNKVEEIAAQKEFDAFKIKYEKDKNEPKYIPMLTYKIIMNSTNPSKLKTLVYDYLVNEEKWPEDKVRIYVNIEVNKKEIEVVLCIIGWFRDGS